MVLAGYVIVRLLRGYLVVLLAIAALIWLLELLQLLEETPAGAYDLVVAAWRSTRGIPESLVDLLPVVTVLATAWVIGAMNRDSEIAVMRSFGLSLRYLSVLALFPGMVLGLAGLAALQWATPVFYAEMDRLVGTRLGDSGLWHGTHGLWIRDDGEFLNVSELHLGREPEDVSIYYFADGGRLERRITAERATILSPEQWRLEDVHIERFPVGGGRQVSTDSEMLWDSFLTGEELGRLLRSPASLPVTDLWRYVADLRMRGLETAEYEMVLWRRLALPLAGLGMVLIAMAVAAPPRSRAVSMGVASAIGLGLGYQLLTEVITLGALAFHLPVIPMALLPTLILILLAGTLLIRID